MLSVGQGFGHDLGQDPIKAISTELPAPMAMPWRRSGITLRI